MLKPQDILVALKAHELDEWTIRAMAESLSLSTGEVHNALKRVDESGIFSRESRLISPQPFVSVLRGIRHVYFVKPGPLVRGIPTAHSAAPLAEQIRSDDDVFVWEHPEGDVRGQAIEPLYPIVPEVALSDGSMYEWLNLIEGIRIGGPRVQRIALDRIRDRLGLTREEAG